MTATASTFDETTSDAAILDAPAPAAPAHLHELFPEASDCLIRLLKAAEESAALLRCDLHAMRDWLEIAGYAESLHAVLLLLILAHEEGSLCIELSEESLARRLGELAAPAEARAWARRIVSDLEKNDYSALISANPDAPRPVIRHTSQGRSYLYFQKFLRHEMEFAAAFLAQLQRSLPVAAAEKRQAALHTVLEKCPMRVGDRPMVLDAEQRKAVELALTRPLTVISGGPGTGKTSIVLAVLRCLVRLGVPAERIALAAPTGRAAQRLADAIPLGLDTLPHGPDHLDDSLRAVHTSTLHQLLDYYPGRDLFRRHGENPIEADVVIVDECSMVGIALMAALFQALGPCTRVILLGDKDQLPSVDAGAVLANLIPEESHASAASQGTQVRDAVILLQTNHRSESHIREVAAAINRQDATALDKLPAWTARDAPWPRLDRERGVRLLEQTEQTPGELRRMLQGWAGSAFLDSGYVEMVAQCTKQGGGKEADEPLQKLFHLLDQTRILTLVRDGAWGCVPINRYLDQILRSRLGGANHGALFPGAPVLITRNDNLRELYNGAVGIALPAPGGGLRVAFSRQDSFLWCPAEALPAWELGFALTVHKSQGSEYGRVLLVLPPTGGQRLLRKELVYTGLTRAKDLAVLCATRAALHLAIQRKCLRESGIWRAG